MNKKNAIFTVLSLLVFSCSLNNKINIPTASPIYTPVPTPVNQTMSVFENIVYDENYLKDCRLKYPPIYNQQLGFRGVYPGITTDIEALERFGKPTEFYEFEDGTSFYSFYNYNFAVRNDQVVNNIIVANEPEINLPVIEILKKYGCPDLIGADATTSDDSFDDTFVYNKTFFMYSDLGVWVEFSAYPLKYTDTPVDMVFVIPMSVEAYLSSPNESGYVVLISFSEALVDE